MTCAFCGERMTRGIKDQLRLHQEIKHAELLAYHERLDKATLNGLTITESENENSYRVLSTSGNTYLVREQSAKYHYEYDLDYMAVWGCNCRAAQYGKPCKHVAAVIAFRDETGTSVLNEMRG